MTLLSKRAKMEPSSFGVEVSTTARKWVRDYYSKQGVDAIAMMRNKELNDVIASDFLKGKVIHRFKLTKKEKAVAEVRQSHSFFYIAKIKSGGGGYAVITIQPAIKQPSEEVRKRRLEQGYGGVVY